MEDNSGFSKESNGSKKRIKYDDLEISLLAFLYLKHYSDDVKKGIKPISATKEMDEILKEFQEEIELRIKDKEIVRKIMSLRGRSSRILNIQINNI